MEEVSDLITIEFYFQKTELIVTFLMVLLGITFGNFRIKGVGFGASGVLIVAMAFGYFYQFEPVPILQDLGIVLFLLSVGLEAGPSFFRAFKQHGKRFITNVLVLLGVSGINTVAIIFITGIPLGVGLGLFGGAFTSSTALVSAMQFSPEHEVIFGYGVAYPFGLLAVIIFISISMQLLRNKIEQEASSHSQMTAKLYRINNEQFNGKLIRELPEFQDNQVVISGILRDMSLRTASGNAAIFTNDVVRLEGFQENVEHIGKKLGEEAEETFDNNPELDSRSIVVENTNVINRSISDLGIRLRYNVAITRVIRANVEFVPRYDQILEYGDIVVAVGSAYQLDQLELFLGHEHQSVERRVDLRSLAAALFLAFFIGGLIIPLPLIGNFSLGLSGGGLIAGLLFGHFGKIGNFIGRFPRNATSVLKELGLAIFFVQVGFETGQSFVESLDWNALYYALYSVLFVVIPMTVSFLIGHYLIKIPVSECFGVICGGMTFTPGLDIIRERDSSERPVVAYSSVYPVALILIILLVQGMYLSLKALGA